MHINNFSRSTFNECIRVLLSTQCQSEYFELNSVFTSDKLLPNTVKYFKKINKKKNFNED